MKIAAIRKLSLIDYPWKISSVIFTQGCNFKCGYCHNPHFVVPSLYSPVITEEEVFAFLSSRIGKIEGVVISGGEPSIQPNLPDFIKKVRSLGFLVKLDTNGSFPEIIKNLLEENLLDYIAMDIKAPLEKYSEICGADIDVCKIKESISIIKSSGIKHQFRTTVVKGIHTRDDIQTLDEIAGEPVMLQNFKFTGGHIAYNLSKENEFSADEFDELTK